MGEIIDVELVIDGIIDVDFETDPVIDPEFSPVIRSIARDYNQLVNKPSINGTELVGNYDEIDPTVPNWAKNDTKPTYTPEEVGSIDRNDEIQLSDIKTLWDSVFK